MKTLIGNGTYGNLFLENGMDDAIFVVEETNPSDNNYFLTKENLAGIHQYMDRISSLYHPVIPIISGLKYQTQYYYYLLNSQTYLTPSTHFHVFSNLETDEKLQKPISQEEQMQFIYGIASGISDILRINCLKFDLSSSKILYDNNFHPILIDYWNYSHSFNPNYDDPEIEQKKSEIIFTDESKAIYLFGRFISDFVSKISNTPSTHIPFKKLYHDEENESPIKDDVIDNIELYNYLISVCCNSTAELRSTFFQLLEILREFTPQNDFIKLCINCEHSQQYISLAHTEYYHDHNYHKSALTYESIIQYCHPAALTSLAEILIQSISMHLQTLHDLKRGFKLLQKAIDMKYPPAFNLITSYYMEKQNLTKEENKKLEYYLRKGAAYMNPDAYLNIGNYYFQENKEEACKQYVIAASYGSKKAIGKLGKMLKKGIGVKQNTQKVHFLYSIGAFYDDSESLYQMAKLYQEGKYGLKRNLEKAEKYFNAAMNEDYVKAYLKVANLKFHDDKKDIAIDLYFKASKLGSFTAINEFINLATSQQTIQQFLEIYDSLNDNFDYLTQIQLKYQIIKRLYTLYTNDKIREEFLKIEALKCDFFVLRSLSYFLEEKQKGFTKDPLMSTVLQVFGSNSFPITEDIWDDVVHAPIPISFD